jgi:hypothetical protein
MIVFCFYIEHKDANNKTDEQNLKFILIKNNDKFKQNHI